MYSDEPELKSEMYIRDVKSSNGTFVNSERLSAEGVESEPYELKSEDLVVSPELMITLSLLIM